MHWTPARPLRITVSASPSAGQPGKSSDASPRRWRCRRRKAIGSWASTGAASHPRSDQAAGDVIRGAGTSPGRVTAQAKVIHGPEEFGSLQRGGYPCGPDYDACVDAAVRACEEVSSRMSVARSVTARSSPASTTSRPCSAPASQPNASSSGERITVDGDAGTVTLPGSSGERSCRSHQECRRRAWSAGQRADAPALRPRCRPLSGAGIRLPAKPEVPPGNGPGGIANVGAVSAELTHPHWLVPPGSVRPSGTASAIVAKPRSRRPSSASYAGRGRVTFARCAVLRMSALLLLRVENELRELARRV